jgi:hypothetical protein
VSVTQAPFSSKNPALQDVTVHAPHVVLPAAQLCVPVPFVTAQFCVPAGLVQLCEVVDAPHTAGSLGVQAWLVTSAPQLAGAPAGVQASRIAGAAPQSASSTTSPKLLAHARVRLREPLAAVHAHAPLRACAPLPAVISHVALRVDTPLPPHTLAEHAPHAP